MKGVSAMWQRHPAQFALGLSALTIAGLLMMLSDAALCKSVGFVLSALPSLMTAYNYRKHRRP